MEGDEQPAAADLFIRRSGETIYEAIPAHERGGTYRVEVPSVYVVQPGFEYHILVRTESGRELTSPARNPADEPYAVSVLPTEMGERIIILSPEPHDIVESREDLLISVLFDPPIFPPASPVLYLDGKEIEAGIEITEDYLLLKLEETIDRGAHDVTVVLLDERGESVERKWTFFFREFKARREISLSGKVEAGWASVRNQEVEGDPFLPYERTSSLRFDAYAYGDWSGRSLYFSASRDPIYDDEVRATGRVSGEHFSFEAGDIYPSFSELTVSWLSGEGGYLSLQGGPFRSELFAVRTIKADTTGGFGTYSQFITGERIVCSPGRWDLGANVAYGWEREGSVPDEFRFLAPIRNLVATASGGVRLGKEIRFHLEAGVSDTKGDDTTSAVGVRSLLTLLDTPQRRLVAEFHSYDPGYYALGNPTVDGGEHGFLLDGTMRLGKWMRQSTKVELYRDRESSQKLKDGGTIVQLYGRTDVNWNLGKTAWNNYFLFRTYTIPYETDPYTSQYGTVGLYARRGDHTLSLHVTRTRSSSSSETESWTAAAYVSGSLGNGSFTWKVGERYGLSETERDTTVTGTGPLVLTSQEERWSFSSEAMLVLARLEWRVEYERIDEDDPVGQTSFAQHLLSLVVGRRF